VVLTSLPSRCRLAEGRVSSLTLAVPLTAVGIDKIGQPGLPNQRVWFFRFRVGTSVSLFNSCANTFFGDSAGELATSTVKKGGPSTNGSDLNKDNIIEPTLDHLMEEDCKALKAYHKVDELFFLRDEVTQQGLVQKDAVLINIYKAEVTPEVWSNPSVSLDDVQVMIDSCANTLFHYLSTKHIQL
jgi:hypothetical protein